MTREPRERTERSGPGAPYATVVSDDEARDGGGARRSCRGSVGTLELETEAAQAAFPLVPDAQHPRQRVFERRGS